MQANTYDVGDVVRASVTFKNTSAVPTDPTTITFKFQLPDATQTTYVYGTDAQLVRDSTGVYHVDLTPTQAGLHLYSWIGTGAVATAEDAYFNVRGRFF